MMAGLFASGRIIDAVLLGVVAEAGLLFFVFRGRFASIGATIAAGAALMLAVRAALTGSPWPVVAAFMLAGLFAHLIDLALRWKALAAAASPHGLPGKDAWPQGRSERSRNNGF